MPSSYLICSVAFSLLLSPTTPTLCHIRRIYYAACPYTLTHVYRRTYKIEQHAPQHPLVLKFWALVVYCLLSLIRSLAQLSITAALLRIRVV